MAGWRNKKGKSGSVATLSSSKMAERASVFPQVAAEVFRLPKQKRLSRYRDVISAVLSRFGDPRRPSAICVAIPQQLSRYGEASCCAMQAIAAHLAVPRPSRNRDFGRDSRRQGCATGPMSVIAQIGVSSCFVPCYLLSFMYRYVLIKSGHSFNCLRPCCAPSCRRIPE